MKLLGKLLLTFFALGVLGVIVAGGILLFALYRFGAGLPDFSQLASYEPPVVTRVHAGDGQLLEEFARQKRVFVPVEAMPPQLVNAFVAAEDQDFFNHIGIDFRGILRAAMNNAKSIGTGRRPEGASTITQQVAKNFLLTNEVSIERKAKEAILAIRIERVFSKDQILELYLNEIYLGRGSYGVAAAALNYFDKALDELNLAEIAYLAALPKAPNNYHPTRKTEAAIARRNYVITRMEEDGYVKVADAIGAKNQSLDVVPRRGEEYVEAGHFTEEVRRRLFERFGEDALYDGGLSVRTTLEPAMQRMATAALRDGLEAYDRRHGWRGALTQFEDMADWAKQLDELEPHLGRPEWRYAVVLTSGEQQAEIGMTGGQRAVIPFDGMSWARPWLPDQRFGDRPTRVDQVLSVGDVVLVAPFVPEEAEKPIAGQFALKQIPDIEGGLVALDPHTGRVLALEGGFNFDDSQFNRVTQANRQPGSAFKPFVYLSALERGLTPATLINDAPIVFDQGPGLGLWKPQNYSREFYGPTPLRVGIEKSRNVMTVRIAQYVGPEQIDETAKRFGIDLGIQPTLSLSLGAGEVTLIELATAYGMLANGGKWIEPSLIDQVQDREGATIWRHDPRACDDCDGLLWEDGLGVPTLPDGRRQVADTRRVYQMVHVMEGTIERGTARRLRSLGAPIAGKTGTTNEGRDTWFMGFTPDLVVGVFVGFDEPKPLGRRETGSSVAAPIFKDFFERMKEAGQLPAIPFRAPDGVRLTRIDASTGTRASGAGAGTLWEAFIPGTEPDVVPIILGNDNKLVKRALTSSGGGTGGVPGTVVTDPSAPAPVGDPATIGSGTGGLY
ncbi:MAG: penicillin-binding protein 1A [Alphaproteobacteria bacterium]|nr:penicillin-binding protein 1A [Alphaproteobacteria bacterium SS10]